MLCARGSVRSSPVGEMDNVQMLKAEVKRLAMYRCGVACSMIGFPNHGTLDTGPP